MSSGNHFDVVVIGAGKMGSSAAYELAKRGHKVLLLEQFDFLHNQGSSQGESRTIPATYPESFYLGMVIESSRLWQELEPKIGHKVYFKASQFDMGPLDDKSLHAVVANCESNSLPYRILSSREVSEKSSGTIVMPKNWIGVSSELGCVIKPTDCVSAFLKLALQKGAILKDYMKVVDIQRDEETGGILVHTASGESFWGKKCVVTVGRWLKSFVESVSDLVLPIQLSEKTEFYWRIKEGRETDFAFECDLSTSAGDGEPHTYGTLLSPFSRFIKVAVHGGQACDPIQSSWTHGVLMSSFQKWAQSKFSGLLEPNRPVGIESGMSQENFIIDFLGEKFGEDVVIGGGFSDHGFQMAPLLGRILADLVLTGQAEGVELKHFRVGRFEGNP